MGIENMRRWPMYIVSAICILLFISLFNSWSLETELRNKLEELNIQLQECSKQQKSCMDESVSLLEQRDSYMAKVNELDKQKAKLRDDMLDYKTKLSESESKVNRTQVDVELCKTELKSLKNLQDSMSGTLETLRFEKSTLTTQLTEKKQKISDLEKEIEKIKIALSTKSAQSSKVTRAAPMQNQSPVMNAPLHEPVLEDAAKEELGDSNQLNEPNLNDVNDFDTN